MPVIHSAQIAAFFSNLAPALGSAINVCLIDFAGVQPIHELVHRSAIPLIELQPYPVMTRNPANIPTPVLFRGKLIICRLGTTLPIIWRIGRLRLRLWQVAFRQLHKIERLGHVGRPDNPVGNRAIEQISGQVRKIAGEHCELAGMSLKIGL